MASQSKAERDYETRAFTIAVRGAAKSGKAALLLALCRLLRDSYSLAIVTSEVSPSDDGVEAFLIRHKAMARARLASVGQCGSVADVCDSLMEALRPELFFIEDGNDCGHLREIADFTIHVVDATSDGIPPEEWADVADADLLVINRTQPGPPVDVSCNAVVRESSRLRGSAPFVLAQIRYGLGVIEIARHLLVSWRQATTPAVWGKPTEPDASELYGAGR